MTRGARDYDLKLIHLYIAESADVLPYLRLCTR